MAKACWFLVVEKALRPRPFKVKAGDIIEKIDGQEITRKRLPILLNGKSQKENTGYAL